MRTWFSRSVFWLAVVWCGIGSLSGMGSLAATATADEGSSVVFDWELPRAQHGWGQFEPGSWKVVRAVQREFDLLGQEISRVTATTESTLESVSDAGCRLKVQVTTERDGHQFTQESRFVDLRFGREPDLRQPNPPRQDQMQFMGESIPVSVYEVNVERPDELRTTIVHYSPRRRPFLLRRRTLVRRAGGEFSWDVRVSAANETIRVLDDEHPGWQLKTTARAPRQTTTTTEKHSEMVPGTLVSQISVTVNQKNQVLRHTAIEVLEYGSCPETESRRRRRGLFRRRRGR